MKITEFFQQEDGSYSMTRLIMFLWFLAVTVVWVYLSILNGEFVIIPESLIVMSGGLIGLKYFQKNQEVKE